MVKNYKPMILVFAGANGSGKSTITGLVDTIGKYVNADEIKKSMLCSDLAAAECAESENNVLIICRTLHLKQYYPHHEIWSF